MNKEEVWQNVSQIVAEYAYKRVRSEARKPKACQSSKTTRGLKSLCPRMGAINSINRWANALSVGLSLDAKIYFVLDALQIMLA